jgi:hypothetical protein
MRLDGDRLYYVELALRFKIMIPEFDENGNLPPGIHWTTWETLVEQFGITPRRRRMIEGLRMAMEQLKNAGCRTIYIDGSFVTNKLSPNDFDACWDRDDTNLNYLRVHAPKLLDFANRDAQKATYRGEIFLSEQPVSDYGEISLEFFQKDRNQNCKGIIAIDLTRW